MLNKSKYFRKLCVSACLILGLTFLATSAKAQFIGINFDVAIAYSAASGSASGGAVGISHPVPFIPNLGASRVIFNETENTTSSADANSVLTLETKTTINTVNFFYNVPFPVVSIALGIGAGTMKTDTSVTETISGTATSDNSEISTPVSEAFIHIGLPFWNTIEFHLGYHSMSVSSIDITSKSGIVVTNYNLKKKNYTGGMTTIGVQIAF
ncbi:MAG: hypothetical protein MK515_06150 [SAR324 cluster bacterium]|nr:hypothetical protein [SAR324 cluster bacterium]